MFFAVSFAVVAFAMLGIRKEAPEFLSASTQNIQAHLRHNSMNSIISELKGIPLFSDFDQEQLCAIAAKFSPKNFSRGEHLLEQGGRSNTLFIIQSGHANVVYTNADGNQIQFARLNAGECVGEMSLIDNSPHSASVYAGDPVRALSLERHAFLRCLHQNPGLSAPILRSLAKRLRRANGKARALATLDATGRLAHALLDMSEPLGAERIVRGQVTQKDLAKATGLSIAAVNYGMRNLRKSGIVAERGGEIILRDALADAP